MRAPLVVAALTSLCAPAAAIELGLPVACTPGVDCIVQNYFDRDPGPEALDFECGHQSYDGHDGTDFRIPTLRDMENGVAVLVAADGTVTGVRDAMPDVAYDEANAEDIEGRECGNGVVVDHGDGWETQYCHMKRGSIGVAAGDEVTERSPIGEIGLSGLTEFPHLHFSVRKDGVELDPFATETTSSDGACANAGNDSTSLWADDAAELLAYQPAFVLNVGFADSTVTMEQLENGAVRETELRPDSPALVFFGRAIGLEAGDSQRLVIIAPDDAVLATSDVEPVDRPKAQFFAFTGKRRSEPWPAGVYRGRYSVIRGGEEIAASEAETTVR
ncbi:MAG: M23 family metallopeptidase [Hyphomicrobiales bacterium]|nr:M23 family metallopeptidase [Hyphomicrobiales bacterium]